MFRVSATSDRKASYAPCDRAEYCLQFMCVNVFRKAWCSLAASLSCLFRRNVPSVGHIRSEGLIRSVRQGRILPPIHVRKRLQEGLVLVSCVTLLLVSQECSECRPHRLLVLNREAAPAYQRLRASSTLIEVQNPVWLVAVFLKVLFQVIKRSSQPAFSVCRSFLFWI